MPRFVHQQVGNCVYLPFVAEQEVHSEFCEAFRTANSCLLLQRTPRVEGENEIGELVKKTSKQGATACYKAVFMLTFVHMLDKKKYGLEKLLT